MALDLSALSPTDRFVSRHVGPREGDLAAMLKTVGAATLEQLVERTVPASIRLARPLALSAARSEMELLEELRCIASQNQVFRSFIGMGYSGTFTPPVILRNVLENPGWYTQYTPYQAEIAQGRLEALLNYQTMVSDLTGMEIANASLLDEGTAAAEAMAMLHRVSPDQSRMTFLVAADCHPQTIAVVRTRALPLGIEVVVADPDQFQIAPSVFGALVQYPSTYGAATSHRALCEKLHAAGAFLAVATDLLALTLLEPPGEWGADAVVGNSQRFGVPFGYGGPHAAFFATKDAHKRQMPGRLIGVSRDSRGKAALRMALGTREQHIRREKATSNICTAQVLLAVMAGMYAVYHGPKGLRAIADRVHALTSLAAAGASKLGHRVRHAEFFDTITVELAGTAADAVLAAARARRMNFRIVDNSTVGLSLDETTSLDDVREALEALSGGKTLPFTMKDLAATVTPASGGALARKSAYLEHPVFNAHHSETEMMRYIRKLESRDLSLTHSMIPLGSCTMKLNATVEMLPVTWPAFGNIHPFAPVEQAAGYTELCNQLSQQLGEITGLPAVSLQPNSGAQGEYAGLLVIRAYHAARGDSHRNVCLIPSSAHGTNPASAAMAGMDVVVVACDSNGNVDLGDLKLKAEQHREKLAALMVTYPSTHGVFEEAIKEICSLVHANGGQVYMDGANLNAQVGLCRPGDMGADVCHVNLHKTFCIPHGGGGPGMGPICAAPQLAPYLPGHPVVKTGGDHAIGPVSAAPFGSASILTISWMYIRAMGPDGLTHATKLAILSANYIAKRLDSHFPVLYKGSQGHVAHECILDNRPLEKKTGITVEDIAKRLMDYGFHAPTISFPVPGTLMIEPTESEPKEELDRFCEALIAIRAEIAEIESGKADRVNNVLKNAPHAAAVVTSSEWPYPYPREKAAWPSAWLREHKFWPFVGRVDNPWGDRNLTCSCPPVSEYY